MYVSLFVPVAYIEIFFLGVFFWRYLVLVFVFSVLVYRSAGTVLFLFRVLRIALCSLAQRTQCEINPVFASRHVSSRARFVPQGVGDPFLAANHCCLLRNTMVRRVAGPT